MRLISVYSLVNRRQRRQQAAAQNLRKRSVRASFGCLTVGLMVIVAGIFASSLAYTALVNHLPSLDMLQDMLDPSRGLLSQPTRFYDRSGQHVLLSLENPGISRRYLYVDPTHTDHFSPELIRAVVGYLDPLFWNSPGVQINHPLDPEPNTIAERLVSDLLLWHEPHSLRRTLRMKLLAMQVSARYGQSQVLEWYLNSANFGHLAYGVDSASQLYLGKSALYLDLSEAALLVASLEAPALNPIDAPELALEGQKNVLQVLQARRVIDEEEYRRAISSELNLQQEPVLPPTLARAFTSLAVDRLEKAISAARLERGGLKVITTLDYNLQMELSCLTQAQIARLTNPAEEQVPIKRFDGNECQAMRLLPTLAPGRQALEETLTTNAVVLDPITGQVLGLLGDTTIQGERRSLSSHEPGSVLTPFAAVASFARGIGPASLVWDIPSTLPENLADQVNPDGTFHGPVRLRIALANDYLAPQVKLIEQLGAPNVWRLAGAMGLSSLINEKSSEIIYKGSQVSPIEISQAYGVFATQGYLAGQRLEPGSGLQATLILYVEDTRGTTLMDFHVQETQAVTSPQLSYLVHHILSDATARWPSLGSPNSLEIGRPSGAKYGIVEGNHQVWVAGYTPQRVAVFWLGFPGQTSQEISTKIATGMWHAMMQYANRDLPVKDWPEPPGITKLDVCDPSGLLPTDVCPEIVREIFLNGSEPTAPDNLYRKVQINRETGRLATVFTPSNLIDEKVFMVIPYAAETWAQAAGLPLPPTEYDAIQPPEPSTEVHISSPKMYSFLNGEVSVFGTAAGDGFRFYQLLVGQGLNPQTWLQVGEDDRSPVTENLLGTWDTTGLEGLYTIRLLVARQDQTLETATIQVTIDNEAPQVRIPYPLSNQEIRLSPGDEITFQAEVSDIIGVVRVDWLVDGVKIGESTGIPYIFRWPARPGEHQLEVRAVDPAGNEGKSDPVHFQVVFK